jgi:sporulation protein YlmC with PRC-barrel domain
MRLSKLLGLRVVDAGSHFVGTVIDVRVAVSGDLSHDPPQPRLVGLVISPRSRSSFLGYERSAATQPKALATLLKWRHRGTFLAAWEDVARIGGDMVTLRRQYTRYSAVLP